MSAQGLAGRVDTAVRGLYPGYFALVMATGIISIGLADHGWHTASSALLVIDVAAYTVLIALTVVRLIRHRPAFRADVTDSRKAFGYFTFVAASCVLGSRLAVDGNHIAAVALLVVGVVAWVVLGYALPWAVLLGRHTEPVLKSANGTWFIWAVGSQSIAVLAATLEPRFVDWQQALAMVAVVSWSVGVFIYAAAAIFVVTRFLTYRVAPEDFTPPYWVAMGATAITVVAGARIVDMADAPMVNAARGIIAGASILFWAFGTWLIPPLIFGGIWRHVLHRVPLRYEPALWSIVFPLGMYGVGSSFLGATENLPWVEMIGIVEGWFAFAVWGVVFLAMLVNLWRKVLRPQRGVTAPVR